MDDDVRPAREPLSEGRFSSPFDPPETREAEPEGTERLEQLRCDPFEQPESPGS
jgi:hypothetical protein